VLVMPSRISPRGDRDGIPNVVLEAMGAGLPVVASHVSGIPEAVAHGATGLLVPPGNPAALSEALETLLNDPGAASRMGAAGRVRAMEAFELGRSTNLLMSALTA